MYIIIFLSLFFPIPKSTIVRSNVSSGFHTGEIFDRFYRYLLERDKHGEGTVVNGNSFLSRARGRIFQRFSFEMYNIEAVREKKEGRKESSEA